MKTATLIENQKIEINETDTPKLDADECLVKVKSAGVCSSDIYRGFESGAYFYPLVMGHEFSGQIERVNELSRNDLKEGDRVVIFPLLPCRSCEMCDAKNYAQCLDYSYYGSRRDGGYREFVNIKSWNLLKIPKNVSYEDAATLEPMATVVHAVDKLLLNSDQSKLPKQVCILGGGFLGLIAVKYIKMFYSDFEVEVMDRNQFKLDIAQRLSVKTKLIDTPEAFMKIVDENRDKYPYVLESCGAPITFRESINLTSRKGRLVWMGNISGDLSLEKKEVSSILRKEISILGTWNSSYQGQQPSDWTKALECLEKGMSVKELVTSFITIEELPNGLKSLHENKMRTKKHDIIKLMVNF